MYSNLLLVLAKFVFHWQNKLMNFETFSQQLQALVKNPVFLAAVSSWFITQFTKTLVSILKNKIHKVSDVFSLMFWRTGGMPSSHSALVCSVTTAIGFHSGVDRKSTRLNSSH